MRIQLQPYEYQPTGRRDLRRPRKRWKEFLMEEHDILSLEVIMVLMFEISRNAFRFLEFCDRTKLEFSINKKKNTLKH